MTYHARFGDSDEIVLPSELASSMGLNATDTLVVEQQGSTVTIKPHSQIVREVQAAVRALPSVREGNVVDELLAERREQADRDNAEAERWPHHPG